MPMVANLDTTIFQLLFPFLITYAE